MYASLHVCLLARKLKLMRHLKLAKYIYCIYILYIYSIHTEDSAGKKLSVGKTLWSLLPKGTTESYMQTYMPEKNSRSVRLCGPFCQKGPRTTTCTNDARNCWPEKTLGRYDSVVPFGKRDHGPLCGTTTCTSDARNCCPENALGR